MSAQAQSERFPWRRVAVAAYVPTAAFSIGQGAIVPFVPVIAAEFGASLPVAAAIAALLTIGQLIGDLPGGQLVARFGERPTMIGAAIVELLIVLLAWRSTELWMLAVCLTVLGLTASVFGIARHAFLTTYVPLRYRARALSTLGGVFRMGMFIGPLLGSLVLGIGMSVHSVWLIVAAGAIVAIVVLVMLPDPSTAFERIAHSTGAIEVQRERSGILDVFRQHARTLATVGAGAAMLALARQARNVLLPLWAVSIGVDPVTTGIVIGISGAIDFGLFFVSGWTMDRFGRMFAIVPSLGLLAIGFLALALSHDWAAATTWFVIAAVLIGIGNGFSAGILMTLGADLANPRNPAPFLGAWRLTTDVGGAAAPVVITAFAAFSSLTWAAAALVATCVGGAIMLVRWLPRPDARSGVDDS